MLYLQCPKKQNLLVVKKILNHSIYMMLSEIHFTLPRINVYPKINFEIA